MKFSIPFAVLGLLIFCVSVSAQRYCPKNFEERLQQDYLRQDGAEGELRMENGEWGVNGKNAQFLAFNPNFYKTLLQKKVLAELPDDSSFSVLYTQLKDNDPQWKQLYFDACKLRRKQRLQIVCEKYPELIYTKHQVLGGSHYAYTEAPSDAQFPERRDMLCGKLIALNINADGTTEEKLLYEAPKDGNLRDPDVSYDGTKIVFSMRNDLDNDDYHLYEINTAEIKKIKQLTLGPGFADVEPCYLPDGNILFNSTRCMQIVDCWWTDVTNLYVIDGEGRFMRRYGFDQVHTNYPKTLADGRVTFTRWDYNDRGQIFPQGLFVMNYDGTAKTEYYGNNSFFPTTILHAREIPNSAKLVAVASGHHCDQRGKLIVIDRSKGTQENEGAQLIAPVRETKAEHIDAYGQGGDQFQYPLAIDEENFIVTYTPDGFHGKNYDIPFGIYYMDIDNKKRELLAWDPAVSCGQPVPLKPRPVPMLRTSPVDYTQKTGTYYVQDVYEGPGLAGVERGTIKELRLVALEFRAAGIDKNSNGGPAGGALVSTPIACDNGSWDVKRVIGTVPVEKDGSAYFEAPARTPVYFQLLNERGETVQTMRSWSVLQPGEMFSCVGCHEPKGATRNNPESRGGAMRTLALRRAPKKPVNHLTETPAACADGFSFIKTIQPIFDRHCVSCHTGGKNPDGSSAPFSLLGNQFVPTQKRNVNMAGRRFSEAYVNLTLGGKSNEIVNWINVQFGPPMIPPNCAGAVKSKLPRMFDESNRSALPQYHKDVSLSDTECRQIALWIDLLVPFNGSYTEDVNWTPQQKAEYAYYQMKRDKMAAIERENVEKYVAYQNGEIGLPVPESFTQFKEGGVEYKKKFVKEYQALPQAAGLE